MYTVILHVIFCCAPFEVEFRERIHATGVTQLRGAHLRKGNCRALWKALDHDFSGITTIEELLGGWLALAESPSDGDVLTKTGCSSSHVSSWVKNHGINVASYTYMFISLMISYR